MPSPTRTLLSRMIEKSLTSNLFVVQEAVVEYRAVAQTDWEVLEEAAKRVYFEDHPEAVVQIVVHNFKEVNTTITIADATHSSFFPDVDFLFDKKLIKLFLCNK